MRKYEKPQLVEVRRILDSTKGACLGGTGNVEDCIAGGVVVAGCVGGGTPTVMCGGGGTVI